jgi:hypothetical protein
MARIASATRAQLGDLNHLESCDRQDQRERHPGNSEFADGSNDEQTHVLLSLRCIVHRQASPQRERLIALTGEPKCGYAAE